jgi:hypothetical protein
MNLYVDEDSVHATLVRLLRRAHHDIGIPSDAGLVGRSDAVQLRHSINVRRPLLSANHRDFRDLHDLIQIAVGRHAGILIVRRDNDRRRDLTPRGIVTANSHLLAASVPIENEFIILNHWR